jgi:hypothetical protein
MSNERERDSCDEARKTITNKTKFHPNPSIVSNKTVSGQSSIFANAFLSVCQICVYLKVHK